MVKVNHIVLTETEMGLEFLFTFEKTYEASQRTLHVESTLILRRYVEGQVSTNFHLISTYFFNVISLIKESKSFLRTFFDVIYVVEKSPSFPLTFFDVILMVEKYTLFTSTFFDKISMGKNFTSFLVKMQVNENIQGGFPLLVTFKS